MAHKKSLSSFMSVVVLLVLFGTIGIHYQITVAQEDPTELPPAETPEATLLPLPTSAPVESAPVESAPVETPTTSPATPANPISITGTTSASPTSEASPQITVTQEDPTELPPAETPEVTLPPLPTSTLVESAPVESAPPANPISITVAMSASPTSGAAPLTVTFSDASSSGLTDWVWDFGDGGSATGPGPHSHTYANPGTYTASLTASGSGGSGTASQQIVVFPPVTPVEARFSYQQTGETTACFTQSSTGPVTASAWDFGDGATSAETDPCHTYSSIGQYTVTLTVTGEGGATSSAAQRISLLTQTPPPVAAFSMNRSTAAVGQTVNFTDQSTGLIQTWFWDFGDGTTSSERQPSKQYSAEGVYTVTLTVTGPGGSDQETAAVTIIPANILTCSFNAPSRLFAGETVTLRNTSQVSPGSFSGFTWYINEQQAATTTDLVTIFSEAGTAVVRLVGLSEDGRSCENQYSLTVLPVDGVTANFSGIRSVVVGEELCLRDQSRGTITAWAWDFGDGGLSTEINPCHAFSQAGRYNIRLTVTGTSGASDSRTRSVTVYNPPALIASATPSNGTAPLAVSFIAEGTSLTSYEWSFPDGSRAFTSTAQFVFDQPGEYTVTVTGSGPVGTLTSSLGISVRAPSDLRAAFSASAWNGIAPLEICFTDRSAGDSITSWAWNFGDGSTSVDPNPCHTFAQAGEYPISLTVSNGDGLSASATSTVRIYSPVSGSASFYVVSVSDLTVCFDSTLQDGLSLTRWEFGDGSTSTEAAPCHAYPAPGVYAVTLIVTDLDGVDHALRGSVSVSQGSAVSVEETVVPNPRSDVHDPALSKIGFLPAGSIGLPGEALHWVTTVTNVSSVPENDLVIVDQVRPELRIDSVIVASGSSYTVNGQRVEVYIPLLLPGQSQDFTIITTVLTSPLNGILDNTVTDNLGDSATATVNVPAAGGGGIVPNLVPPPLPDGPIPLINGVPELVDFAGREFCFTPNFTNAGTREGYGPYITLVRDVNLALNSISYLGFDLTASPFLVGSGVLPANDPIEGRAIPGTPGQAWITVRLPVGSLETISPPIPIDICMQSLPLAALGVPLPINIYPGYEFGDTPTGANGPIANLNDQGPMDNAGSFTPILVTFAKSNTLPESEVPPSCYPAPPVGAAGQPGPACAAPPGVQWPYEYTLSIELAAGQTLTANTFTDTLDPAFEFYPYNFPVTTLADAVIVGGTCTPSGTSATFNGSPITALPPLEPPGGGTLAISFASIVNPSSTSTCTLTMRYRGFINDILSESAAPESYAAVNNASFVYSHVSGPQPVLNATNTVDVRNLQIQKSASPGAVTPDTVVNYTLSFQLSEYIGIQTLSVTDIIPDGIDYNVGSAVVNVPGVGSAPITGANESIVYGVETGTLVFNVTGALPGPYPSQGTITITYTGTVRQTYRPGGTLTGYVSANDTMANTATASFTTTAGQSFTDETGASVQVIPNSLTKTLISTPVDSTTGFVPGEPVTFRLVLRIPSGDTRNLIIEDNFPLPVFIVQDGDFGIEASTFTLPDPTGRSAPFDVTNTTGYCASYPNVSFPAYARPCGIRFIYDAVGTNGTNVPAGTGVTVTRVGNTVRLNFDAPVETNDTSERRIVIELTAGIIDRPFADGLFLANRSLARYTNTAGVAVTLNADDYVQVAAPDVQICKGIINTTNPASVPVAGTACGIPGAPNNDLTNVDASDVLTYQITAQNIGGARAYGVQISDNVTTLPQLTGCTLVSVTNGAGVPLAFTGTFPNLTLTNPLPGVRSFGVTAAQSTAVVTYTCTVASNLAPSPIPIVNQTTLVASTFSDTLPGGVHVNPPTVPFPPRSDVAQFTPRLPDLTKTRVPATAAIGDLITYTLQVDVPGGTMNNVSIVDTLDAGLAFVDCTNVVATAPTLTSSLGAINTANFCNDGTGANNPVISSSGGVITWNFGSLTSTGTTASDVNSIIITYTAVVLNETGNVRGALRNNSAVLGWDNPAGGRLTDSASAPDTRIIEPTLQIDKTASPTTNVDADDLVTFTLVIRHAAGSDATAYDVQLTDVIPAGLTYVAGSLTNTAGVVPATLTESSGTITATYNSLTTAQTSTLQYQARLAANVQPGQVITNTAQVVWTSVSGTPAFTAYNPLGVERTGNTADPGGAANNYRSTDPASVTVANPSAAKTITATSLPETGNGSDSDPDLTIGETVTYQITVTFREGLTRGAVIRDNLPTGTAVLGLVSSRIVSIGANLSFSAATPTVGQPGAASDTNSDGVLDRVEWTLNNVTNTADNVSSAADTIVVEVVARVLNVAANSGLAPTQDLNVINTAQIRYTDSGGTLRTQSSTATVDLVEPRLTINKTVSPTSADAGDTVTYTVVITNTGTAPAFNVVITDPMTATAPLVAGTVTTTAGTIVTGNTVGDTTIRVEISPLAVSGSVTITYQALILPSAFPGQQIINTASQTFNSMPDNSGRPGSGSDPATVTVLTPDLTKNIIDTSESYTFPGAGTTNQYTAAPDLTIGETVTFQMPIIVPEGTSNTLRLVDTLPSVAGGDPGTLTYVSSRVVSIGSSISGSSLAVGAPGSVAGQVVTFDFTSGGPITNTPDGVSNANDIILVEVVARAENLVANAAGDLLTNRAALTYDGGSTVNATASVDLVEPQLDVQKTAAPSTNLNAGDVVTFTIVVNHTAASTADAFDLRITDVIPAGLTYVGGSLTNVAGVAATLDASAAPTLTLTWDALGLGQTSTVTYQARVDDTITHNVTLTNTASLGYSSLDDGTPTSNDPNERTYTDSDPASVTTNLAPLSFVKSVAATSEAYTDSGQFDTGLPDLTIGETVTYELRARLQEGVVPVTITDTLPAGLVFLSVQLAPTNGANISLSGPFPAPTVVGQVMTLNLGNVTNTADNVTNADDDLVILITARAADLPVNVGTTGTDLVNTAVFDWGGGTLTDTETVEIVEPQLDVQKTAAPSTNLNAGDVVTFTIVVNHTAASTADAFDLRITDVIPAGLTYVGGSLTNVAGVAATLDASAAPTLTLTWDALGLGQTSTVTYQARVDDTITHNVTLTNTASLGYSSLDDGTPTSNDANERTYTDSDPASVTTNLAPLSFVKSVAATSEPYTGSNQFDTGLPDLTIGETVTYELRARLQEGVVPVTITDTLPAGLVFLNAQLAPTNGANIVLSGPFPAPTVVGQVMTLNLGNVTNTADNVTNADDDLVIWITARAADLPVNVGTTGADLVNTAVFDWGGGTLTDTETVEIVEPQLSIQKSVSPTTDLNAGTLLTYTLVLAHTAASTADAQDIRIQDAIPSGITFEAVNAATSTCDDRPGWSLDTTGLPSSVIFRFDDLPLASTCTLTYTATIANSVTHGQTLTNVASLGYSSLDDGTPDTNDPNERPYTGSDDATVTTNLAPLSFVKSVVATSEPYTGSDQFDTGLPDLTIGETVTYELRARLQEGTIPVILTDTLPDGLVFLSVQLAPTNGANISLSGPFPAPTVVGQVMTLNLGNVVNAADNITDANDDLVVWVIARAADLPVNVGTTGTDLVNTAVFDWGGGTLTDTETVEIVEPQLDITITASPSTDLDAGDVVTYTITVTHLGTSTADALDVVIANLIPADMTYLGNLAAVTGPLPTVSGTNPNINFTWDTIPLGSTYTFTFQAVLDNTVSPAQTLTNTATLTWNTLDDDNDPNERNYTDSAQVSVSTRTPALDKTIIATSLAETGTAQHVAGDTDLNIGETVTYQIVITMPEGDAPLVLTDNLPDVMTVVSATVVRLGANITTTGLGVGGSAVLSNSNYPADGLNDRAVFNFGIVTNTADNIASAADELVVEVVARLDENALNVNADRLTNTASLDYGSGSLSDTITIDVTEPLLDIQKSALVDTGRPGDIIEYTITVAHLPASTGPAYDLVITDPLLANLTLIPGTVTTTRGTVTAGNAAGDTQLRVDVPLLNLGETVTITYQGLINANITPPVNFVNTAALAYDSASGAGGRQMTDNDTHTIRVNDDIYQYAKTITDTSVTQTGSAAYTAAPDATIGETVTFQIEAYLPEGVTSSFVITDNLPDGLIVVSSRVLAIGSNLTVGSLAVGSPGTPSNSNYPADGLDDRVVFNFGSVTNVTDGIDDDRDIIRVEVVARVYDDQAGLNVDGRTATNRVLIDYGPNRREATAPVDIVEPRLALTKTFSPRVEGRGHELSMTLELVNTGGSTAYNIRLDDPLNIGLCLNSVVVNTAAAPDSTVTDTSTLGCGGRVNLAIDQLAPGERILVTTKLQIDPALSPIPQSIPNTAETTYESMPSDHPDAALGRRYRVSSSDTLLVDQPTLTLTKVAEPTRVRVGDLVIYTLTVTNTGDPAIDAYDVLLTDTLPDTLTLISAQPAQGTCTVSGQTLTCALGTLLRNTSTTVIVEARVAASAVPNSRIVNRALVSSLEGSQAEAEAAIVVLSDDTCKAGCPDVQLYHSDRAGNWDIFRLNTPVVPGAPDANQNLTQNPADDVEPSRSPDGRWMAFTSNRDGNWEIYVAPIDGSPDQAVRVTYNTVASDTDPVWGPSDHLVYESSRDGNWELYLFNLRTGQETRLTDNPSDDLNAFWSPDGTRIIFQSNRSGRWQLYELNLVSGNLRSLSDGSTDEVDASYSNTGTHILFRAITPAGSVIMTMNANGSNRQVISAPSAHAANAVWSPNDSLIAYQSDLDGDLDIYIYERATGKTRKLTDNTIADYAPAWRCGTERVLFTSEITGSPEIFEADTRSLDAPAIAVLDEAVQWTNHPGQDIYPLGAPGEENASLEGRLPADSATEIGHTAILRPDRTVTPPDLSVIDQVPWQPIATCLPLPGEPLTYRLDRFPAR
jgi:uncharacterized repeat protein (TIGR01451 family)/fimbrial isopeptide formation D2 family protein